MNKAAAFALVAVLALAAVPAEAAPERWLAIAPPELAPALEPLAVLRRQQGLDALAITYAEFIPSPKALSAENIRNYLKSLPEERRPGYLLLAGDWSRDGINDPSWALPCFYTETLDDQGQAQTTATDQPYADLEGDHRPELAVGRIPARSAKELESIVNKILAYEGLPPGPWQRSMALIGGEGGFGVEADAYIEAVFSKVVSAEVPSEYGMSISYAGPGSAYFLPPAMLHRQVLEELDAGPLVWTYVGHGWMTGLDTPRWGGEAVPLCGVEDLAALEGEARRSVFVSIACHNNYFDLPDAEPCLGEAMLANPRGPVASIASTRVSHPYANCFLARGLVRAIFVDGERRMGRILNRAKLALDEPRDGTGIFIEGAAAQLGVTPEIRQRLLRDHYALYNLLGDPALRLRAPEPRLKLLAPPRVRAGEDLRFNARFSGKTGNNWLVRIERDRKILRTGNREWVPGREGELDAIAEAHAVSNLSFLPSMTVVGPGYVDLPEGDRGWRGRYPMPAHLEPGAYVLVVTTESGRDCLVGTAGFELGPPTPDPAAPK